MNKLFKQLLLPILLLAVAFTSCDSDDEPIVDENELLYYEILGNYVNTTILPTYKAMAEAALKMREANEALKTDPSDATMKAASDAWMEARIWWELNEAFLFGPIGEDGYDVDGHIDSWPLELNAIQEMIVKENGEISGEEAWLFEGDVIGFHVAEYLLYRDGKSRPISDLNRAELNYLIAVTDAMVWDCILAYVSWAGEENVSAEMRKVFNENPDVVDHFNSRTNYKNFGPRFKLGTTYSSLQATVSEISVGCETIADEVGATKIAQPYETGKTEEVESWYSWHSIDDYANNIESIKNAYLGGVNDNTRTNVSLSTYVAQVNPDLDKNIKNQIDDCILKIRAMGKGGLSFYEVVRDQVNRAEVDAAEEACLELAEMFAEVSKVIK